jgi:hypothetical protein
VDGMGELEGLGNAVGVLDGDGAGGSLQYSCKLSKKVPYGVFIVVEIMQKGTYVPGLVILMRPCVHCHRA